MGKKFVCVYGVLLATFLGNLFGNESKSNLFGFHSEIVRANTYNLIGINVATQPHGRLVRTIGSIRVIRVITIGTCFSCIRIRIPFVRPIISNSAIW